MIDFEGTFDEWQRKTHAASLAPTPPVSKPQQAKTQAKPVQQPQKSKPKTDAGKDNPYARKFGRHSVKDLEKQIAETEKQIVDAQDSLSRATRDANKSKSLNATISTLSATLKELEAEYFLREA